MNHVIKFSNKQEVFPVEGTKAKTIHQWEDQNIILDPETDTITLELTANHIHFDKTGIFLGYWCFIKNYAPVRDNSMYK